MQSLQEWAFAVCCTCVIGAMLTMVAPTGSSRRLFSMIVTLMTLCVLFRSFSAARDWTRRVTQYTFEESALENPALEAEVESGAKRVYAAYLKENLRRVLEGEGILCKSIDVSMDNSEDGCICIGQVEVIVKNEDVDRTDSIRELVKSCTGVEPVIITR